MSIAVDRSGRVPIYHQVAMNIEQRIASGEWPVGAKMPSELELAEQYDVSRMTIRQALSQLEKDRLITRNRPFGTFVSRLPRKIAPTIGIPASFVESLNATGHTSHAETLSITVMATPSPDVAALLNAGEHDRFIQYDRLVTTNGTPLAFARSVIPYSRFPGLENYPLRNNSIHATIEERFGTSATRAEHWIEADVTSDEDATILGARRDHPMLVVTSVYYDKDDQAIGHMVTRWLGDLMKMHMQSATSDALLLSH